MRPKLSIMADVIVRRAQQSDVTTVAAVLAEAFDKDPGGPTLITMWRAARP